MNIIWRILPRRLDGIFNFAIRDEAAADVVVASLSAHALPCPALRLTSFSILIMRVREPSESKHAIDLFNVGLHLKKSFIFFHLTLAFLLHLLSESDKGRCTVALPRLAASCQSIYDIRTAPHLVVRNCVRVPATTRLAQQLLYKRGKEEETERESRVKQESANVMEWWQEYSIQLSS